MKTKFRPCKPCCGRKCLVDADDFNRADEADIGPPGDSTGKWVQSSGSADIEGNKIIINKGATLASELNYIPDILELRQFFFHFDFQIVNDSVDEEDRTFSFWHSETKGSTLHEFEVIITVGREATTCGGHITMKFDGVILEEADAPGMLFGQWIGFTFCYSAEQKVWTVCVQMPDDKCVVLHAGDVETDTNPLDDGRIYVRPELAGNMELWLDNFELVKTVTFNDDESGDYGEAEDCDKCGCVSDCGKCSISRDEFDDASVDECLWREDAGDWIESGGWLLLSSGLANARITWIGSWGWTGLDTEGRKDITTVVTTHFWGNASAFEAELVIHMQLPGGEYIAKATLAGDAADTEKGTLKLIGPGGELESLTLDGLLPDPSSLGNLVHEFKMCYDGYYLSASLPDLDAIVEYYIADDETVTEPYESGLGTGAVPAGNVFFTDFEISHNAYDPDCPECEGAVVSVGPCPNNKLCKDDKWPQFFIMTLDGTFDPFNYDATLNEPECCNNLETFLKGTRPVFALLPWPGATVHTVGSSCGGGGPGAWACGPVYRNSGVMCHDGTSIQDPLFYALYLEFGKFNEEWFAFVYIEFPVLIANPIQQHNLKSNPIPLPANFPETLVDCFELDIEILLCAEFPIVKSPPAPADEWYCIMPNTLTISIRSP